MLADGKVRAGETVKVAGFAGGDDGAVHPATRSPVTRSRMTVVNRAEYFMMNNQIAKIINPAGTFGITCFPSTVNCHPAV
jgi:hypothetical protein